MDIYAKAGQKVRYTGRNGYEEQRASVEEMGVQIGDVLTVSATHIGKWSTNVAFHEIVGMHNSVMFDDLEQEEPE